MGALVPVAPTNNYALQPVSADFSPETIGLGRYFDPYNGHADKLTYNGERNMIVLGPNGCGKSAFLLTPMLTQMRGNRSVVVVDTKGELAALTAPYRGTLGRVVIINPYNLHADSPGYQDLRSEGYNPLIAINPSSEDFLAETTRLAEAMVPIDNEHNPFFESSGCGLINMLLMFVVLEAHGLMPMWVIDPEKDIQPTVPTIGRVRDLLCQPSGGVDRLDQVYGLPALARHINKTATLPEVRNLAGQFTTWNKTLDSIRSTAMDHTKAFDEPQMRRDLANGAFDFREIKEAAMTVYLILPATKISTHSKWLRIIISNALKESMRERKPWEPRVLFILEEMFALGYLRPIVENWAVVRGFGVQIMGILQSLTQLKKLYGDLWENFLANTGVIASFTPNDFTTAEWLSKRAGDTTRMKESLTRTHTVTNTTSGATDANGVQTSSWSRAITDTESTSFTPEKIPLITPHAMLGQPRGHLLLFVAGRSNPTMAITPPWWAIEQCVRRIPRSNPYHLK